MVDLIFLTLETKDQCADSLTKFLRGGQDQLKARVHLSLLNLENWLPGRGSHTKACGVKNFSDPTRSFGPRVCRVFLSEPEASSSEVSGPGSFHGLGPVSLARRKKRLCHNLENGEVSRLVAILAQIIKPFDCENAHRVVVCTGIKDDIMVIIGRIINQYDQNPDDKGDDDWCSVGATATTTVALTVAGAEFPLRRYPPA